MTNNSIDRFRVSIIHILLMTGCCLAQRFDAGGGGGLLLYLDEGTISHYNITANYNGRLSPNELSAGGDSVRAGLKPASELELWLGVWGVNSNLPQFSVGITGFSLSAGYDFKGNLPAAVRPKFTMGLITLSDMVIREARAVTTLDGVDAFYAGMSCGIGAGDIEITPEVFFANARALTGDLYYFYGKPNIPAVFRYGLSAKYQNAHRAGVTYDRFDFEIVNDDGFLLFASENNYSVGGSYGYAFPFLQGRGKSRPYGLDVTAGLNYAYVNIDGALTAENQGYFLFPYAFYSLAGKTDGVFGWTAAEFTYRRKNLSHKLSGAAVNFFTGELYAGAHYKYRKFFGDDEVEEDAALADMSITRGGIAVYSLEGKIPTAAAGRLDIGFELRKILGYWWKMDDIIVLEDSEKSSKRQSFAGMAKTVLLSGLSLDLRIEF